MARVQVEGPSRGPAIQPGGVQSDTFTGAPRPVIDNNLSRLADSLGVFNAGLQRYSAARLAEDKTAALEAEKARAEAAKREAKEQYEAYRASRTETQQLDDMRAGRVNYASDPIMRDAWEANYGQLEARALAQKLDEERKAGGIALGNPEFNPDAFIVNRSAEIVDRLRGKPAALAAFRQGMEHIRDGLTKQHQEAYGRAVVAQNEQIAWGAINDTFKAAADRGLTGKDLNDAVRATYKDIGPRLGGGSLDISYQRLDALYLDGLKRMAKDPRYAAQAIQVLDAERTAPDGKKLPAMSASPRTLAEVEQIRGTALKSLGTAWEGQAKASVGERDLAAFMKADGSFVGLQDVEARNPFTGETKKFDSTGRKEAAVKAAIATVRAENQGRPDFERELDLSIKNGVKHPEWFSQLEAGFIRSASPEGTQDIAGLEQNYAVYKALAGKNYAYVEKHLSKDARKFFDTYDALVGTAGMQPTEAAQAIARIYAAEQKDPQVFAGRMREVEQKINGTDFNGMLSLGGTAVNQYTVREKVREVATSIVKAQGIGAEKAIELAMKRVKDTSAFVNGQVIMSPNVSKEDEPVLKAVVKGAFDRDPKYFRALGIDSDRQLSIQEVAPGRFAVVRADTGAFMKLPVYGAAEDSNDPAAKAAPAPTPAAPSSGILPLDMLGTAYQALATGVTSNVNKTDGEKRRIIRYQPLIIDAATIQKARATMKQAKDTEVRGAILTRRERAAQDTSALDSTMGAFTP